jgi:predicted SprT family Zn-dependent metalloprotease
MHIGDRLKKLVLHFQDRTGLQFVTIPRIEVIDLGLDTIGHCKVSENLIELNGLYFSLLSELSIDYLILHELCHLFLMSHNLGFRKLLESVDPQYRYHEHLLQKEVSKYKPKKHTKK